MIFFKKRKDGGPESPVDAYFIFEIKTLATVAILKFNKGRRESFHTHAFNAYTWFLSGDMIEEKIDGTLTKYKRRLIPKYTDRKNNHRVLANKDSWCLTIRGPWSDTWTEDTDDKQIVLTHGRKVVSEKMK